jgi:hypothetical protein
MAIDPLEVVGDGLDVGVDGVGVGALVETGQ